MCVTSGLAQVGLTRAFTHASMPTPEQGTQWVHYTGYQVSARNLTKRANCLFLHFPCQGTPWIVDPEVVHTQHLMEDITRGLPVTGNPLEMFSSTSRTGANMVEHGDYYVVLTGSPNQIPEALSQIPEAAHRPIVDEAFENLVEWYERRFPGDGFVLVCFNDNIQPNHPILVGYTPDNDDVLFVPGLEGHDGNGIPSVGKPMRRNIKVAFSVEELDLPHPVLHRNRLSAKQFDDWAPKSVSGFWDRREFGGNFDYAVPLLDLQEGMNGSELLSDLVV